MKWLIINRRPRWHPGWKIVAVFIFFLCLTGIVDLTLVKPAAYIYVYPICLSATVVALWNWLDGKTARDLGLKNWKSCQRNFWAGFAWGIAAISVIFIVLFLTGSVSLQERFSKGNLTRALAAGFVMYGMIAVAEELFIRGYCFTVLKQTGNQRMAVLVSSLIFAAMHIMSPSFNFISFINLFLLGVFWVLLAQNAGNLWAGIGGHFAWNFFQGNVYGLRVSGSRQVGLLTTHFTAPNWINGGRYGPEGSAVTTVVFLLSILWVLIVNFKMTSVEIWLAKLRWNNG